MIRLDKLLGNSGYGTRSEVRRYIKNGHVLVNGEMIRDFSKHVHPDSEIHLFDEKMDYKEFYYFVMNKPPGYISATYDPKDKTVIDLLSERHSQLGLFPVGRLDKDTEGLLLLTNNGKLAFDLLSPKKHVPKLYYAKVEGEVTEKDIDVFQKGIQLDPDFTTLPAKLHIIVSGQISEVEVEIQEGKFHQIKRMFLSQNKEVTYLKRLKMGNLQLDPHLPVGEYRELTHEEINKFLLTQT